MDLSPEAHQTLERMSDLPVKNHFILIHGVGGGAWCWYKIHTILESFGHQVTSLDLKGSGINPTDPNTVIAFEDYNEPFIDVMDNLPDKEQVILVAHSAGGQSVTYAIHKFGCSKIKMAIYVAATMLKHGFCTPEDFKAGSPDLSEYGDVTDYTYGLGPDQPPTGGSMKREFLRKLVYNMTPDEEYRLATMLLRPWPVRALRGEVQFIGGEDFDNVPRTYIKTLHDKVLKPEQQDAMIKMWPPSLVFALETDHSALLSAPSELSQFLLQAASSLD
ncbi:unnamed protein product [Rhodiola kirilowii]